jgi:hypothetical protein
VREDGMVSDDDNMLSNTFLVQKHWDIWCPPSGIRWAWLKSNNMKPTVTKLFYIYKEKQA